MLASPLFQVLPMPSLLRTLVFSCLLLWCAVPALAEEYFVSTDPLPGVAEDVQFRSIQAAVDRATDGDVVTIYGGTYREAILVKGEADPDAEDGLTIRAASGATVVLTGADRMTEWKSEGDGVYSHDWPHTFLEHTKRHAHPDDEYHRLIGRVEQVIDSGYLLHQVLDRDGLSPGSFYIDEPAGRLYAMASDGGDLRKDDRVVEASVRPEVLGVERDGCHIIGLTFRYAANAAQHGLARFAADDLTVSHCTFERGNGAGTIFVGQRTRVEDSTFRDNGQLGVGGSGCHGLIMLRCNIEGNNTKGFNRDWEAGGLKITFARDIEIRQSTATDNRGHGLWFDIGCETVTVSNCLLAHNEDSGLFYEISYGLHAHDNLAHANGLLDRSGAWGAQAGIVLSSSEDCTIERNLLVGNREGFAFREQDRTTPRLPAPDADPAQRGREVAIRIRDITVSHNLFAYNRDVQVAGWFDIDDGRHMPPKLADLHIAFEGNRYAMHPGQDFWQWGVPWRRGVRYDNPEAVADALMIAAGEKMLERFDISDAGAAGLVVTPDADTTDALPKGAVPGLQVQSH